MAADDGLKVPVVVSALGINAASLPAVFSQAYQYYVLSQSTDFVNVAGKANEAGQGAYDAQVRNGEQDLILADHEQRLDAAEITLADHETRITQNTNAIVALTIRVVTAENSIITLQNNVATLTTRVTTAEGNITTLQSNVSSLTTRVTAAEGNITALQGAVTAIQGDYVSKSAVVNQIVQAGVGSLIAGSVASPTTDKFQVGGSINISGVYKVNGTQVLTARQTGWTAATGTSFKGTFNADLAWTIGVLNILQIQQIADALTEVRKRTKAIDDVLRTHGLIN